MLVLSRVESSKEKFNRLSFKKWFIKQFGKRPSNKSIKHHISKQDKAYWAYQREKLVRKRVQEWDHTYNACLYVWNIKSTSKRKSYYENVVRVSRGKVARNTDAKRS